MRLLTKLAISNDTGDCITTKLLNVLSETEEPALQDLVNILEHLSVDSQQFAKIIKALPTEEYLGEDFIRAIIHVTDPFDILALKRALRSENVQRLFLQYFRQEEILTDINSAWSTSSQKEVIDTRDGTEGMRALFLIRYIPWIIHFQRSFARSLSNILV